MIYDLYAVTNHYGSLSFGHYTAFAMNPVSGAWYDFNDSSFSQLPSADSAVTDAAYVLYYKRRDFFPDGNIDFNGIRQIVPGEEPPAAVTGNVNGTPAEVQMIQEEMIS
mmetsp:Transcript_33863/g.24897  ORF Transcript_33863/g.24897 Transcript_33863/m.24897 type:complete len:109 (+) Transcript_33863:1366-1692(+)